MAVAKLVSPNSKKLKALRSRSGLSTRKLGVLLRRSHTRVQYYEDEFKEEFLPLSIVREFAPHLVGKGHPPITAAEVYALAGALPPDEPTPLVPADTTDEPTAPPPNEAVRAPDAPLPPYRSEMTKDVPVFGTVAGGSGQGAFDFELNGTIVDYVRRPPRIAGRADVFAAYVQGESMMHWRRPGQLIYVEKAKPPAPMDYVLVELLPPAMDGVRPALVKQLLGITPTKIKLRQHNPPKDFEIERRSVLQVYRIMDWDELMGV